MISKEFICKGCGEKFNKDMQSSNVGYCYICNEFYMQKQVADLEAKLAEKEEQLLCKTWYKEYKKVMEANEEFYNECAKLREQLAEKDKEIVTLKEENERNKSEAESQHKSFIDCFKDKMGLTLYYDNIEKQHNQDKIDYAVEKLIRVKIFVDAQILFAKYKCENKAYCDVWNYIDQLITEIKEGK